MESDDLRTQLHAAERGEAAVWLDYPADRWWQAPALGLWATAFVLAHGYADPTTLVLGFVFAPLAFLWWDRRRRGAYPDRGMPRELQRSSWVLAGVAALVVATTWPVYVLVAPWAAAPVAGVTAGVGAFAYGRVYRADAARVRQRLG